MKSERPAAKRRIWTVADLAAHLGVSHRQARALLLRLHREMGGRLLLPSEGAPRRHLFVRAQLAKAHPEYFEDVQALEARVVELEERLAESERRLKMLGAQTGANSAALAGLQQQRRGPAAA